ncbi:MAG TPA: hypothetical protein DEQ87_14605 [Algoriphagus sp.]|jgi:hypothetical protein|uniref:hypothetical protein n=1 Tax=unclassified Algoriphagus TaxID=2641541 RepID=UPI000C6A7AE5|nr:MULTISPECIES: hypothetical protein [unclassified Algoriphagus]MAL12560.1 hypothetical protein [Algoriphagus sp.]MAN88167.1 hypothetical protein [Algoriphagus sp.]HAD51021.1 hypothetical protein [Algoriphagus sp.]HAH36664.1 hypothetical protein [Algoriphagus sp.]HAS57039.1 hypothetical protein [Algoriphagus sp.]|tara:strand:- start:821 stop:1030 length:210 start_codon:yes stop_codon:yes gene_type:complete
MHISTGNGVDIRYVGNFPRFGSPKLRIPEAPSIEIGTIFFAVAKVWLKPLEYSKCCYLESFGLIKIEFL